MSVLSPQVSGFTFIKDGLSLEYPILESIKSIEPLCDEIIINVGFDNPEFKNDDGTYQYLRDHLNHSKFKFIKNVWNPELTSKGLILSEQTNLALAKCKGKVCQYIQGDEAIHEDDLPKIHNSIIEMIRNPEIEALVFDYIHFYGNVDIYRYTRNMYRREVRTIRNNLKIKSYLDAQGFRHEDGITKVKSIHSGAKVYHYGWARKDKVMHNKVKSFSKLFHGKNHEEDDFNYRKVWGLKKFKGSHPKLMSQWIEKNKNEVNILDLPLYLPAKEYRYVISDFIEKLTGHRLGEYKSFIELKN